MGRTERWTVISCREKELERVKTMRENPPRQKRPDVCVTAVVGRSHKECVS